MEDEIVDLMNSLKGLKEENSYLLKSISDFGLFLEGLNELKEMVEMDEVKESIINQVKFLLVNNSHEKSKQQFDGHMIHTVLSGVPGVGKTALGIILAKIWLGIGVISKKEEPKEDSDNELKKQVTNLMTSGKIKNNITKRLQNRIEDIKRELKETNQWLTFSNFNLKSIKKEFQENPVHEQKISEILETNEKVKQIQDKILQSSIPEEKLTFDIQIVKPTISPAPKKALVRKISKSLSAPSISPTPEDEPKISSSLIAVVSREDFVGGFLGQTAIKTEKLLRECLGKVLFIDEAYSLVNDEKDTYGKEALTVLNRFMSEHSDELVVIFAGYKDLMDETIFKYQPGLKRRCSWYFHVKGYSNKGLAQIFRKQLKEHGWEVDEKINLDGFFEEHIENFPAFGGDTLRLAFYCKICYSSFVFDENYSNTRFINQDILEKALKYLKRYQITGKKIENHLHMYL